MKLLFIDTETGGLDPQKHSLLSIGMVVWEDGNIIAQKEIFIDDGNVSYTKKAMSINKIQISKHNDIAYSSKDAIVVLLKFIKNNFDGDQSIKLAGHNISFDIAFLKQFFKDNRRSFSRYFSHRSIDTSSILSYLQICNKINGSINSSSDAFRYFKISTSGRHSALCDAMATAELFNHLINAII